MNRKRNICVCTSINRSNALHTNTHLLAREAEAEGQCDELLCVQGLIFLGCSGWGDG